MTKYLFLDIDGVMNSTQSIHLYYRQGKRGRVNDFCPIAVSNLNYIIEQVPDLKIVISSTWRLGNTVEQLKEILVKAGVHNANVVGKTPNLRTGRDTEIRAWLTYNADRQEYRFAVLDDGIADMHGVEANLVRTSSYHGLLWADVLKVLNILIPEVSPRDYVLPGSIRS